MSGLRPVDDVITMLLDRVPEYNETLSVPLLSAQGLCLAEDVTSPVNVPPADNSAMDGYAINSGSLNADEWIPVSMRVPAGYVGDELADGTAARIFTGAPIPPGADTVVIQENTESREGEVKILELPLPGANIREQGQDIRMGSCVATAGEKLTPAWLGVIASVGVAEVKVKRPLRVAILSTGDELVEPGRETAPGQIYNSNRYVLAGLVRELGMEVIDIGIVSDTPEATEAALIEAAVSSDCILSSGGVSVGEEDHVKAAVERLGSIDIWKLAIKPGKPLAFGEVRGTPFFGLPGNPVSTYVTFSIVARPYLRRYQGFADYLNNVDWARAGFSFSAGSRREYLRVKTHADASGQVIAEKFPNQGSGVMSSVAWCNALAEVEIDQSVSEGDLLKIYPVL